MNTKGIGDLLISMPNVVMFFGRDCNKYCLNPA